MVTVRPNSSAPVRSCVGCRSKRPQTELVRCAVAADGTPVISRTANGRGAWLCAPRHQQDRQATPCLEQAIKRRGFERAWKRPVGPTEHEILKIAYTAMKTNMEN
jgi:predicted RNA-binding protein YlxR (DUF448 family)